MPRIRKKTSNRGTTNDRKKIKQKVRESRKKAKKAVKKNPQWKSKTPKDPGIPNNFPFKDQILAEVAEQRRIDAAEKLRKKEERKALRVKAKNTEVSNESDAEQGEEPTVELEELKGLQIGNDAVGGIGAKQLLNAKTFSRPVSISEPEASEADEDEVPMLINRDLPNLKAVLDDADVVIEVLDARDPLSFRSSYLEELITAKPGRRILLVLNKIDTCPRESVSAWADYLRTQHPTVLFRSAAAFLPSGPELSVGGKGKGKAKARTDDALGVDSVLACLGRWAKAKKGDKPLAVAVVGIANVGKSSFVNSLVRSCSLPVYVTESSSRGPTTTELAQEVLVEAAGKEIRLIDTPGLSWEVDETAENSNAARARDILLRSKGRIDRLKDPTSVVADIVTRSSTEDLMLLYSLPAFAEGDSISFLSGLARSNFLVKKRGELDLIGASRILLRDWSTGKFARYTTPPTPPTASPAKIKDAAIKKLYDSDAAVLETVTPRKDLRKSVGIVKITCGEVDSRRTVLEEPWLKEDHVSEEGDVEDEMDVDRTGKDDVENIDDEEESSRGEEEEEEEEPLPPSSKKQKRKRTNEPLVAPPSKKVAFAPDPKISKQARKAGSTKGKTQDHLSIKSNPTLPVTAKNPVSKANSKPVNTKPRQKVANIAAKNKTTMGPGGDEAYDFGKFF